MPLPTESASGSTQPTRHVSHIDGLRAIAVLAVIVYHLNPHWLPGGFCGVDIFFVISGFVVSTSVGHWKQGGFGSFLGYFYARRLQRIAPALLACLVATSLATALFIPPAWLSSAIEMTGAQAFFGLSNYFLANHRESYFSPTTDFNPYVHTWSLGVEEQFYVLFPLLFFAWIRGGAGRQLSMVLMATAVAASMTWAWHLGRTDPATAFYTITTRLWELASGAMLYQLLAHRQAKTGIVIAPTALRWQMPVAWISFALVGFGLIESHPRSFPWPGAWAPVFGTLGLLGFLHGHVNTFVQRILGCPPMAYIGRQSYSLYLWHWPVFVLMRWTFGLESISMRLAGVALTFLSAAISFQAIERPTRYSSTLQRWPRLAVVALGVMLVTASWWASGKITQRRYSLSLSTVTRNAPDWYPHIVRSLPERPGCTVETHSASARIGTLEIFTRVGCAAPREGTPAMFVIGDSHAAAYLTVLTEHVLLSGSSVIVYNNSGCTFVSLQPEREGGACPAQAQAAIADVLERAKPGDILFLAALRLPRFSTQFAGDDAEYAQRLFASPGQMTLRRASETEAIKVLAPIAAAGLRIVLEAPPPLFRAPPFRCADWFNASNPICKPGLAMPRDDLQRYRQPVLDSFARMAPQIPGASTWDPFATLCPRETCDAMRDGRPLYFDGDHLSGYGNTLLLADFERFIAALPDAPPLQARAPRSPGA